MPPKRSNSSPRSCGMRQTSMHCVATSWRWCGRRCNLSTSPSGWRRPAARRMMSDLALTRLAWSLCALTLLILASSLLLILLGWSAPLPQGATPWRDRTLSLVGIVGAPTLGGLIASRRPRNPYGWLWLGFGLGLALQHLGASSPAYARVVEPGTLVAPLTISHVLELRGPLALAFAPFLLLLFPTGRLPSRLWRPVAWIAGLSGTVIVVLGLFFDRPETVGGIVTITVVAAVFVTFGVFALSALSLVVRYRRAGGMERQQLKWFALAAVLGASFLVGQQLVLCHSSVDG